MQQPDYYEILQVDKSADIKEIKRSYNQLVLLYHPDKLLQQQQQQQQQHTIDDKFTVIQKAWECLRDDKQRKLYDHSILEASRQKYSITDEIDLDDMDYQQDTNEYYYPCRSMSHSIEIERKEIDREIEIMSINHQITSSSIHFEEWAHINNEILYTQVNEAVQIQVAFILLTGMLGLFLLTTLAWIYYRSPISRFYDIKQSFNFRYINDSPFTPMTKELEYKIKR
ncbi:DNAJ heat shock N-terminal domain-containing protein [Cavenderia fasciculata]|uniref:DNAJ heat shock N-terminal domain-containing protein n=1 Tax=Cavenderia fasciculata TaxID=261658 RepID=F4PU56_CACFS|nr:DNAJ heat shock N-terminal domain-containing protein [Cavenderia fasciculata]EGG20982.1 DNAJ heat shock N-terminal domain-containing protein [Cavenderia fasciculata]|eukprot:XP_004358832.1 DNAJ heat shock N-terminal domain-containing protein [Cavenderia fasciculata]